VPLWSEGGARYPLSCSADPLALFAAHGVARRGRPFRATIRRFPFRGRRNRLPWSIYNVFMNKGAATDRKDAVAEPTAVPGSPRGVRRTQPRAREAMSSIASG
jgi:hypothetical protein